MAFILIFAFVFPFVAVVGTAVVLLLVLMLSRPHKRTTEAKSTQSPAPVSDDVTLPKNGGEQDFVVDHETGALLNDMMDCCDRF